MDAYIRQIQSIEIPMIQDKFIATYCDNVRGDTSKRKREDCGLEDIRLRIENLLGIANEFVNRDKLCDQFSDKRESQSFSEYPTDIETKQSPAIRTPSRIPRRNRSFQETTNSGARSRSVTPQRVVQSRIQYFEALSQNKDVYKSIMSQERELGIERTSIPISVKINATKRHSLNFDDHKMPLFNQMTPIQATSVFVFAAPSPVRCIPKLKGGKFTAGSSQTTKKKISSHNYDKPDTPSKIPVLDKSKFFASEARMSLSRMTG